MGNDYVADHFAEVITKTGIEQVPAENRLEGVTVGTPETQKELPLVFRAGAGVFGEVVGVAERESVGLVEAVVQG